MVKQKSLVVPITDITDGHVRKTGTCVTMSSVPDQEAFGWTPQKMKLITHSDFHHTSIP